MNDKCRVLQDDLKDCGVCALLSIIKFYHGNVSKEYLRELTKTTNNGVNAFNLIQASRILGFESYGIKGSLYNIEKRLLPVIAHVVIEKKYPHFVVIYHIDVVKKKILVMDPAKGFTAYLISDFLKISSGYYLILKPKHLLPKLDNKSDYMKKVWEIVLKYKQVFISIISMSLIYTLINIIGSYNFKLLYEATNSSLDMITIFLSILIFIRYLVYYYRNNLLIMFNSLLDKYLVKDSFYHIIYLPYLYYFNHTSGDLLTRINDLGNVKELLGNLFISVFVDLLLAFVILIFMLNISLKLSLFIIISLVFYGIIVFFNSKNIKGVIQSSCEKASLVNNNLVEALSSFETIKNLSLQSYIFNNFTDKYNEYTKVNRLLFKKIQRESFLKNIVLELGNISVIYFGIKMIDAKSISIISLITFISLANYLIEPIKKLMDLNLAYQNAKESIRRIKEIYAIPKEKVNKTRFIKYLNGNIDISNISYSYNGINNIINDLTLEIKEGEKVLVYGNSGSGKSTLIKLLIKYLDDNYKGNITIGGYDLKDLDICSLRKNICYISQNEYLYTDSIYQNITLGRKIKYNSFLDIAKNLFINEIVKNSSLGYNLVIENNGENISGGERKRIIVARSILKKANIYIYDETFSEMDVDLERKILEYLFNLFSKKTIIVISHRFSNEDLFDKKIKVGGVKHRFIE